MSLPIHLLNIPIITNASMAASINSIPVNLNEAAGFSIQAVFTGTPVGTLQLQSSNDYDPVLQTGTWTIVEESQQGVTAAGSYMINVEFPLYSYVRLQYVRTSSTGTLNARINAKRK